MFAFQISSPSLVIARWQRQSVHNTYKWGLLATAVCYVLLLYMTIYHKSLLFVNKNVSLHYTAVLTQIAHSWEQTLQTSLTSTLITSFLKNSRCFSVHSWGLLRCLVPELTALRANSCCKININSGQHQKSNQIHVYRCVDQHLINNTTVILEESLVILSIVPFFARNITDLYLVVLLCGNDISLRIICILTRFLKRKVRENLHG